MYKIGFITIQKDNITINADGSYEEIIDTSEIITRNGHIISCEVFPYEYSSWILANTSISMNGNVTYGIHNTYSSELTTRLTIRITYVYL